MNRNRILCKSCHVLQAFKPLRILLPILLLAACSVLPAPKMVRQNIYVLEAGPAIPAAQLKHDLNKYAERSRT